MLGKFIPGYVWLGLVSPGYDKFVHLGNSKPGYARIDQVKTG